MGNLPIELAALRKESLPGLRGRCVWLTVDSDKIVQLLGRIRSLIPAGVN